MLNIKHLYNYFPIIQALKGYNFSVFRSDFFAGITVGVVLIPQAIAYSFLMGVPALYGLYTCILPLILYAIFGTCRQLNIGPVAVTALLVMNGISNLHLADPFSEEFIELVLFTGFLIGVLQILMSIFRMGFLVNLISQPVLSGFISAAAIIIIISQLEKVLGIEIPNFNQSYQTLWYVLIHLTEVHWITFGICVFSLVVMFFLKKWNQSFPGALLVLVITTTATYVFKLHEKGIEVIGEIPKELPFFRIPKMDYDTTIALIPTVLIVTFIGYIGTIGISKSLESKNRNYILRPNQELFALGIAKVFGSFFQSVPSSGSYSRSAINDEAGGKTTVSTLISVIIVLISLLFLTSFFYYIPKSTLSAIILISVFKLINVSEAKYLLTLRRRDFIVMIITFIGTLVFKMEYGILIGVILSFIFLQYYSSKPHIAELVNISNTRYYRNCKRFPEAKQSEKYLIVRFDDQLYFGNTNYFKDIILEYIAERNPLPNFLILNATNMHDIDSSGIRVLKQVHQYLEESSVQLLITGAIGPVRDLLKRSGFTDKLGKNHYFMTIADAVDYIEKDDNHMELVEVVIQHNNTRSFLD